jgi:hypothetical protein
MNCCCSCAAAAACRACACRCRTGPALRSAFCCAATLPAAPMADPAQPDQEMWPLSAPPAAEPLAASAERGRPSLSAVPASAHAPPAGSDAIGPAPLARPPKSEPSIDAERRSGLRRRSPAEPVRRSPPGETTAGGARRGAGPAAASCRAICISKSCSSSDCGARKPPRNARQGRHDRRRRMVTWVRAGGHVRRASRALARLTLDARSLTKERKLAVSPPADVARACGRGRASAGMPALRRPGGGCRIPLDMLASGDLCIHWPVQEHWATRSFRPQAGDLCTACRGGPAARTPSWVGSFRGVPF